MAPTCGWSPVWVVRSMRATASRAPFTSARWSSPWVAATVKTLRPWSGSEWVSSSRAGAKARPIAAMAAASRPSLTLGTAMRIGCLDSKGSEPGRPGLANPEGASQFPASARSSVRDRRVRRRLRSAHLRAVPRKLECQADSPPTWHDKCGTEPSESIVVTKPDVLGKRSVVVNGNGVYQLLYSRALVIRELLEVEMAGVVRDRHTEQRFLAYLLVSAVLLEVAQGESRIGLKARQRTKENAGPKDTQVQSAPGGTRRRRDQVRIGPHNGEGQQPFRALEVLKRAEFRSVVNVALRLKWLLGPCHDEVKVRTSRVSQFLRRGAKCVLSSSELDYMGHGEYPEDGCGERDGGRYLPDDTFPPWFVLVPERDSP